MIKIKGSFSVTGLVQLISYNFSRNIQSLLPTDVDKLYSLSVEIQNTTAVLGRTNDIYTDRRTQRNMEREPTGSAIYRRVGGHLPPP